MRFLILLFLTACATSAPSRYEQGAFRPAPPVFVPSQDAPHTVGQPGYVTPPASQPERSPHTRVLPETPETRREPGLWAGDEPKATVDDEDGPRQKKKPNRPQRTDVKTKVSKECMSEIFAVTSKLNIYEDARMRRATLEEMRCFHLRIMQVCTQAEIWAAARRGSLRKLPRWSKNNLERYQQTLRDVHSIECRDVPITYDMQSLYLLFVEEFNRVTNIPREG